MYLLVGQATFSTSWCISEALACLTRPTTGAYNESRSSKGENANCQSEPINRSASLAAASTGL